MTTRREFAANAQSMRENAARMTAAGKHYAAAACLYLAARSEAKASTPAPAPRREEKKADL